MKELILLAWRYISHHKTKTVILVLCLSITIFLPLSVHLLVDVYGKNLISRAEKTPYIIGSKGNRYDLVLSSLYFQIPYKDTIPMSLVSEQRKKQYGQFIPIYMRYKAHKLYSKSDNIGSYSSAPIIAAPIDYFRFRQLSLAAGKLPGMLGQAVVGAKIAKRWQVQLGDYLLSEQQKLYDIATVYPLKMPVVGILAETNTPDDEAIFVGLKTAWIIGGLGHGHADVVGVGKKKKATARLFQYNEITVNNIDSFHFHGNEREFPITAIIFIPANEKSKTLLLGDFIEIQDYQILSPIHIIGELLQLVFKIRNFFYANFILITVSTLLFLLLIIILSLQLRKRERMTLFKMGCGGSTLLKLQIMEYLIVVVFSVILAIIFTSFVLYLAPNFIGLLLQ